MLAGSQEVFRSEDVPREVEQHKMCNEEVERFGKGRKLELLTLSISGSHVWLLDMLVGIWPGQTNARLKLRLDSQKFWFALWLADASTPQALHLGREFGWNRCWLVIFTKQLLGRYRKKHRCYQGSSSISLCFTTTKETISSLNFL